jgi:hypothetical protein
MATDTEESDTEARQQQRRVTLRKREMLDKALRDMVEEWANAQEKFPDNKHQLTALNEEVGELNQAMLEHQYGNVPAEAVYEEAMQVAAMAMRVALEGDHSFDYESAHAG